MIKYVLIRKFNGILRLMYLFSNLEYTQDDMQYKKELEKFDHEKIMTAFETTLTQTQCHQLELPVKDGGIGGMSDNITAMILSNYLQVKDKIQLFINDSQTLTAGIFGE